MKIPILIKIITDTTADVSNGYLIGAVIALLIFGYLIYTLFKPEKF